MEFKLNEYIIINKSKLLANEIWGLKVDIPIFVNNRLTKTLARFVYNDKLKKPISLEFSKMLINNNYNEETINAIILHELCHYALFVLNKPFKDGDEYFEKELKRIGACSTGIINKVGEFHNVHCSNCNKLAVSSRSYNKIKKYINSGYISVCCKKSLYYNGSIIKEDNYKRPKALDSKIEEAITKSNIYKNKNKNVNVSILSINDIIEKGPRGVTNKQMIPAIKAALEEDNKTKINLLKAHYPKVFESSTKYIGKKYKSMKLSSIVFNKEVI